MQEEEQQCRRKRNTDNNTAPGIVHRSLNELTGVPEPDQFHAGRQLTAFIDLIDTFADAVDNFNSVGFTFFDDIEIRRRLTVHKCFTADFPAHQVDFGDVAQIDPFALMFTDFKRFDIIKAFEDLKLKGKRFTEMVFACSDQRVFNRFEKGILTDIFFFLQNVQCFD